MAILGRNKGREAVTSWVQPPRGMWCQWTLPQHNTTDAMLQRQQQQQQRQQQEEQEQQLGSAVSECVLPVQETISRNLPTDIRGVWTCPLHGLSSCCWKSGVTPAPPYHRTPGTPQGGAKKGRGVLLEMTQSTLRGIVNSATNRTLYTLVTVLFLVMSSSQPVRGQPQPSWADQPKSSSVREGSSITLTCRFSNLGNSKIAWLKDNNNIFVDGDRWGAAERFNVSRYESGNIGGYDLTLSSATRQDDSDYTCQLQSGTLIATAHLTVLGMW